MRGKLGEQTLPPRLVRIIPAHAGQTSWAVSVRYAFADHPRACGANKGAGGNLNGRYGSSPRMRGKPHQRVMPPAGRRIIPAHAGQTRALARPDQRRTDHPRACGANSSGAFSMIRLIGSSPRMRGKRVGSVPVGILARIIPAHAGQTSDYFSSEIISSDHPRACGANLIVFGVVHTHLGSSPRMRGKLARPCTSSADLRSIPAHAGQTRGQRI